MPYDSRSTNLNEAGSLYGSIIYQKAPVVMRHLEKLMGDEVFRDGLREYLKAHAFGNATWSDLIAVLDRRTPTDLVEWSRVWVEEPGRPIIRTEIEVRNSRIAKLAFHQTAEHSELQSRASLWPQQLRVALGYADGVREVTADMSGASVTVADAVGLPAPLYVLPTGGGWAYGVVRARFGIAGLPESQPPRHRRPTHARRRVGHDVGCAARPSGRACCLRGTRDQGIAARSG